MEGIRIYRKLSQYRAFIRQYGLARCARRAFHDWQRKHGLLNRRFPLYGWTERPLASWLNPGVPTDLAAYRSWRQRLALRFFFLPGQPPSHPWMQSGVAEADAALQGRFRYFSDGYGDLGLPVDWFANPFTGQRHNPDRHWCDLADFEAGRGDIKYIWEPARFAWTYALIRAYALSGDQRYAEGFWKLFESFRSANPPNMGPNWQCGQEVGIRVLACAMALYAFWTSPATTDQRVADMVVFLAASAERIYRNINYARWQMGNHAVSEAAALYTVGLLFPELKDAARWHRRGLAVLEDEARQFCWSDGSYAQHSMNYQRLMLHQYLWTMRLAQLNGESFSPRLRDRLKASYRFLHQMQDSTGRLPNYGPNDGALILPLNGCDYGDYRPVLGAMHYLQTGRLLHEVGPWAEDLVWLFGPQVLDAPLEPIERVSSDFHGGGYFTVRSDRSWAMIRCHTYRNRPNQADMLHMDLWHDGCNVLRDSGSYSYFDPQANWNSYFLSTAAHNTVVVGGVDQMIKGPRFRWYSLLESRFVGRASSGAFEIWQGEHYGYQRLASRTVHRRCVCRIGALTWLVVDDVVGEGVEGAELFWHMGDVRVQDDGQALHLSLPNGPGQLFVSCSDAGAARRLGQGLNRDERMGWQSLFYGRKDPAPTLRVASHSVLPIRFLTLLSLEHTPAIACCDPLSRVVWRTESGTEGAVELFPPGKRADIIRSVQALGGVVWTVPYPLGGSSPVGLSCLERMHQA